MAGNRRQRVNCMDLSPILESLNLWTHDAEADSDSDLGGTSHTPRRQYCMDLGPFIRSLSSDSDAPEARRSLQGVSVLPEEDSSGAITNRVFVAEEPRALVIQERSQWLNIRQQFEDEYEEEIEAAIVSRTSTVVPGEMDFAAEFDGRGEWDDTWNESWSGRADGVHDPTLPNTSEHDGEACSHTLGPTPALNAASVM
eukprot:TRINITY_DN114178_c0_g1_i1.p1 TRINITY_DN114178_c0_g1~~TRINITY_DN114178_c0_g1_i1.p1  ORF type:complete len:198 (-),score=31.85 TRINITY_DN114178_c0_g1_i1:3-596(-)